MLINRISSYRSDCDPLVSERPVIECPGEPDLEQPAEKIGSIERLEKNKCGAPSIEAAADQVLDGFSSRQALVSVLKRVALASIVYAAGSTMFIYALVRALDLNLYGWGPLQFAEGNVFFVVYFACIMLPFSLFLSWCCRYRKAQPYQRRIVDMKLPAGEAYELGLAAALSLAGTELILADEDSGEIVCTAPLRASAEAQEIRVRINELSTGVSRLIISSQPILNPVQHVLFGFTLSVDGERNKHNVERILAFLRASQVPESRAREKCLIS